MSAEIHTLQSTPQPQQGPAARVVREFIQEFDNAANPPVNLVIAYKKADGEVGLLAAEGTSFLEQLGLVDVARSVILQQNLKA